MKRSDRSQVLFRHGTQEKTLTRAGYVPGAAALLLAQVFLLLMWFALGPFPARAETVASFSGVVMNQTGAGLADVAVTITNVDSGATRGILTNAGGRYLAAALPAGNYEIRATKRGFVEATRTRSLAAGQTQTANVTLTPDACANGHEFVATDCTLTWHGVTFYGAYDVGVGWVSHGLPENAYNYEGESLVNRNSTGSRFLVAPNNLQQTGLGIRAREEFAHGWAVVFNASTGINPQSGQLANASRTDIDNNGLPRAGYSEAIDGARAGQPLNDEFYGGVASPVGTLTFGRQRALGTDTMLQYDPGVGGYAFSYIGYNGTMAGGGDTEDTRWDDALKYRVTIGPVHVGAMYKFEDGSGGCYSPATLTGGAWSASSCTPEAAHNTAYGFNLGGAYRGLSSDVVYQHYNDAISVLNPLLGPQSQSASQNFQSTTDSINTIPVTGTNLIDTNNTLYGIVTDNSALMGALKYTWDKFRFYGGYEYIWQQNPHNPLGVGALDQGGYLMSGVEDNNLDTIKLVQIWWLGAKYSITKKMEVTGAWYYQLQHDFRTGATCTPTNMRSSCAGTLNEVSGYLDYHFTPRFDAFAGLAYSDVTGGLGIAIPHGPGVPFNYDSNVAPTIGGRFAF